MIFTKITNSLLSLFLTNTLVQETNKPFHQQTIESVASTPDDAKIINTFVDNRNTVWIVTENNLIYYKLVNEKTFHAIDYDFSSKIKNSGEFVFDFVKINYEKSDTFFIYSRNLSDSGSSNAIYEIYYENNQIGVRGIDVYDKINNITSFWADDRGILIAGEDIASGLQTVYSATLEELDNLTKISQPDSSVFANSRKITSIFRADKNSDLKNMIVLATSSVEPFVDEVDFSAAQSTILTATSLDGKVFNKIIDTMPVLGAQAIFTDTVISKYADTGKTAYLMTGTSGTLSATFNSSYAIGIDVGSDNKFTYFRTWKDDVEPSQTKKMVSQDSYVFTFSKNPFTSTYRPFISSFYLPSTAKSGEFVGFSSAPNDISDPNNLNVNQNVLQNQLSYLAASGETSFFYMPSMAINNLGDLYIGIGNEMLMLEHVDHANPGPDSENSNALSTKMLLIIVGSAGGVLILGSLTFYLIKKNKKKKN